MPGYSNIAQAISGYEAALVADSANPQPSYTVDGKKVERTEWRAAINDILNDLYLKENQAKPYVVRTRMML
jgi:hypothetical protein